MVEVVIETGAGATRVSVAVRARSIRRAVSLVEELFPGSDVRVKFPIDPEAFFVEDRAAEMVSFGQPGGMAA